jgi:hypothetical protein
MFISFVHFNWLLLRDPAQTKVDTDQTEQDQHEPTTEQRGSEY